jgi:hypothetical protein
MLSVVAITSLVQRIRASVNIDGDEVDTRLAQKSNKTN